ncbi:MAG: hypothetical protein R3Y13_00950 [bacterium]
MKSDIEFKVIKENWDKDRSNRKVEFDCNTIVEERIKELLSFWFYSYGNNVAFFELEEFESICDNNLSEVSTFAALLFLDGRGPSIIIEMIKKFGESAFIENIKDQNKKYSLMTNVDLFKSDFFRFLEVSRTESDIIVPKDQDEYLKIVLGEKLR